MWNDPEFVTATNRITMNPMKNITIDFYVKPGTTLGATAFLHRRRHQHAKELLVLAGMGVEEWKTVISHNKAVSRNYEPNNGNQSQHYRGA